MCYFRPEGWIYEKEAILEYILKKKVENAKLMKQYEKQREEKEKELKELSEINYKEKLDKFLKKEGKLVASSSSSTDEPSSSASAKIKDESKLGKLIKLSSQ